MKKLLAKFKGGNFKGFFLQHGEKLGMGTTALLALICLFLTNWRGYAQTPQELKDKAAEVESKLRKNIWPADKKAEFGLVSSDQAVAALNTPVQLSNYMHGVLMSPKLYTYQQPAEEPIVVTATELQVSSGQMPLDVVIPFTDETEEGTDSDTTGRGERPLSAREKGSERAGDRLADRLGPGVRPGAFPGDVSGLTQGSGLAKGASRTVGSGKSGNRPAGGAKNSFLNRADEDDLIASGAFGGMPAGLGAAMRSVGTATGKARGVRYNVITGIVDRKQQLELLKKALHLESPGQVPEYLEYVDFKIQRQRAQPGPKPWSDDPNSWKELDTSHSIDLLVNEAVDFDPDVVAAEYINDAITSPLPHRLDGDWDFAEVGHPKIPMLDLEGREFEAVTNMISAQLAGETEPDDEEARYNRGFRRAQKDPTQMRQRAMSVEGGANRISDMRRRMMSNADDDDDRDKRRGMGMGMGIAGGRMGRGKTGSMPGMAPGMRGRGVPAGVSANFEDYAGGMGAGGAFGVSTVADTLLFRYFDFDIEPGECYRYRVQIVISNPSEGEEFVSTPDVAVGQDRASDWSKPSPLVIVPKDVEYSLVRIYKRSGRREGAVLNVVQFDTDVGTLISDNLQLRYGEYVGGTRKSDHLNLSVPSFQAEEVNFTSKEVLVDSAKGPEISSSAAQDLKLNARQVQKLVDGGALDHAVTLNRFGELQVLDADVPSGYRQAKQRYKAQADEYADLKEESTAQAAIDKLNARDLRAMFRGNPDDDSMPMIGFNPLKQRGKGAKGGAAGMIDALQGRVPGSGGGRNAR